MKRVLRFKTRFVDTWKPQIDSIAAFLALRGISCGSIGKGDKKGAWQAAYRLDVVEVGGVLKTKSMLTSTVRKRTELQAAIDYLEGRMTGNQILEVFNGAVKSGRRRGKVRFEDIPFTREEGLRLSRLENARNARAAHAVNVGDDIQELVRTDHRVGRLGCLRLSRKYGLSTNVVRRFLGVR